VNAPPEALQPFLTRAARRLAWISAAEGAAAGLCVAIVAIVVRIPRWPPTSADVWLGAALALAGALVEVTRSRGKRRRAAYAIERRSPDCRNLLITAAELDTHAVTERVAQAVYARAAQLIAHLDLATLFPARDGVAPLAVVAAVWGLLLGAWRPAAEASHALGVGDRGVGVTRVDVVVTPPAYTRRSAQTLHDPARIQALAGSRIQLTVRARATELVVETLRGRDTFGATNNEFMADVTADADGYVALEPRSGANTGPRRLIGLTVTPDNAPRVRITAPGNDLRLQGPKQSIDIAVDAGDDIGLASLTVRYTKVSGSGERFTFTEGELPITVTRASAQAWSGRAHWNLETLGLAPGDMVVYHAVATDHRPGGTPSESDSFIAEVPAPGGNAAPGFDVDPEQERYAVSQQMVILKTERLTARKAQMSAEDYANAAAEIAAEQRKVRAEFVFMMGGELADAPDITNMTDINEEAEANGEDDILAGRNANQGRVALLRAIRSMSRAATSLTTADLPAALPHERAALTQLERAFSHARIILRALTEHERLDLSRRLTGPLAAASPATRPRAEAEPERRVIELRRALADVAALASGSTLDGAGVSALAERVLRIEPSSREIQQVADRLSQAATELSRGDASEARRSLDESTRNIATALRAKLLDAPARVNEGLGALNGALTDALRRPAGSR
jgi:hypothetical protein